MAVTFLLFFTVWPPMYMSVKIYVACFWAFYQLDQIIIVFCVIFSESYIDICKIHRSHGQQSLVGYSSCGHKELYMTEPLTHNIRVTDVILCFSNLIFFHCLNKPWFLLPFSCGRHLDNFWFGKIKLLIIMMVTNSDVVTHKQRN